MGKARRRARYRPRHSPPEDKRRQTDDVLDGHAAYRAERERLEAVGPPVADACPRTMSPEDLAPGRHGFQEGCATTLAAALEMLSLERGED